MLIFLVGFRICYFIHFDNIRVEGDGDQCCNEYLNIFKYSNISSPILICIRFVAISRIWMIFEYFCMNIDKYLGNILSENTLK